MSKLNPSEAAAELAEAIRLFYTDPEVFIEAEGNRVVFVADVTHTAYVIHEGGTFTETVYYADDNVTRESEGVSVQAEIDHYRDLAAEWASEGPSTTSS